MKELINKIIELSYKNQFSLYYKPGGCLVRVYYANSLQHKEAGKTLEEALELMVAFLSGLNR